MLNCFALVHAKNLLGILMKLPMVVQNIILMVLLKGKYVCQYLNQNNNLCTLTVNPGWAESMFGITMLALVHNVLMRRMLMTNTRTYQAKLAYWAVMWMLKIDKSR